MKWSSLQENVSRFTLKSFMRSIWELFRTIIGICFLETFSNLIKIDSLKSACASLFF
jgi:hypothetical protein